MFAEQRRRRAGLALFAEHPRDAGHAHAAGPRVIELEQELALAVREQLQYFGEVRYHAEGDAPRLRVVEDFVGWAVARLLRQFVGHVARVGITRPSILEARVVDQLGAVEELAHHFPLCLGQGIRADPAVGGRQDERWRGADIGAADADIAGVVIALGDQQRHIDRGFEHGHVYMISAPGLLLRPHRDQGGHGGVCAGQGLGHAAAELQRLAFGAAAEVREAAGRAGGQVAPLPVGAGAGRAEAGDGDEDQARVGGGEVVVADAALGQPRLRLAGDDQVRAGEDAVAQGAVVGSVAEHDAALARVGVEEGRAGLRIVGVREGPAPARRVARGGLDLDHVGAEIAEQLGREGGGQALGDVGHPQPRKRVHVSHRRSSCAHRLAFATSGGLRAGLECGRRSH